MYRTANTPASLASLRALGSTVFRQPENILNLVNVSLEVPDNQVVAIADRADVFNVEPYTPPKKKDEVQDQIVAGNVTLSGGNVVPTGPGYRAWLQSNGFTTTPTDYPVVDVVDDGIDDGSINPLHPDFHQGGVFANPSRLVFNNNCTTDTLADGQAGHGNLNAGIVGAYDNGSGLSSIDVNGYNIGLGVSPYGRVAGTKIFQNGTGNFDESACGGTDVGTVLAAYNAGANITSNSWGSDADGAYDAEAQAYDTLTRDATDSGSNSHQILHVFSAGNCGVPSFQCSASGPQTIGSPGTAKNVLTVGATENVRADGVTDGCGVSAAASADNIADFSSRGPTADGRNKPDIVAPGTHIQGPASKDPTYDGSGVCGGGTGSADQRYYPDGQTLYTWSSGTSHSAPAVAGVASLVYNYYGRVIKPGATPSPAMLKALILNAPRYLTGVSANDTLPSPNQGWGDANLGALFDPMVHRYVADQTTTFTTTGETFVKNGTVTDPGKPFRVSLVWTDAPGSTTGGALVNDLDLEVTVGGQVYKGNVLSGAMSVPGGTADSVNNVENVFLPTTTSGPFTVKVTAANLAGIGVPGAAGSTNQDFALVVSNGDVTAAPNLGLASVTTSDTAGGNGNGVVEPGETIALTVGLLNSGDAPATAVSGTLATSTSA
ncbi:MAG: S8 family serine peptidase, partial [Chloroflexota bacterium]|nr:S8 family serine peptidase [Chloroflexota bacterium]